MTASIEQTPMIPAAAQEWQPWQQQSLDTPLYIRDGLRPIGAVDLIADYYSGAIPDFVPDESRRSKPLLGDPPVTLPVLAQIDIQNSGEQVLFMQSTNEQGEDVFSLAQVRPDESGADSVIRSVSMTRDQLKDHRKNWDGLRLDVPSEDGSLASGVIVEYGGDKGTYTWKIRANTWSRQPLPHETGILPTAAAVSIHEEQAISRKGTPGYVIESKRQDRKNRLLTARNILAGYLAVKAAIGTGGVVDMVGDPFNHAHDTVYGSIPAPEHTTIHKNDLFDGIPLSEYPKSFRLKMMKQEQGADDAWYKKETAARSNIAHVMDLLDGDDYQAVQSLADKYRAEHADDILGDEQLHNFNAAIDASSDPKAVMAALDGFTQYFGIRSSFATDEMGGPIGKYDPDTSLDDLKDTAHALVQEFGWLPKQLMAQIAVKRIHIGTQTQGNADAGGDYQPYDKSMNLPATMGVLGTVVSLLQDPILSEDNSTAWSAGHEAGHAFAARDGSLNGDGSAGNEMGKSGGKQLVASAKELFWSTLVDIPQDPTAYGSADADERFAENFSGIITQTDEGLARPDDWRRFNSPVNKDRLRILYQIELNVPNVTAYLVAHNDYLMGRSNAF